MSQLSLRRTLLSTAAAALVVGGSLGFVGAVAGADPTVATPAAVPAGAIALNNNTAGTDPDCPDDGFAYWHFILASTGNGLDFTEIHLELAVAPPGPNDLVTFSGAQIVPNADKLNNVFVAVPAGHTLDDIVLGDGSYAFYEGEGSVVNFTLSHVCEGDIPTTTTSSTSTTTTSTTSTTTTSTTTTSTTTTSTAEPSTTTTPSVAPTTLATVLGTVQTQPSATAVETAGELPYTGSNLAAMVVSGLCVLAGGGALVGMARTGRRTTSGS